MSPSAGAASAGTRSGCLTPNWMTRLPGYAYEGPDQDGFMTAGEVVGFFEDYAESFDAPVRDFTSVRRVRAMR